MTVNKENIQKVIDRLRVEDDVRFDMGSYINDRATKTTESGEHWCGTTCCIAGYASVILHGLETAIELDDDAFEIGQAFFEIDDVQASLLFTPSTYILDKATPEEAIKVLEHLRDTGKVKWSVAGYDESNAEDYEDDDNCW